MAHILSGQAGRPMWGEQCDKRPPYLCAVIDCLYMDSI